MKVQIFGAVSSPFVCNYALRATAEDFRQQFEDVADKVVCNFYVDNFLDSFDTVDEALSTAKRISDLLTKGGFHLHQWLSSFREFLAAVPPEDVHWTSGSVPTLNLDLDDMPTERTLGLLWNSGSDSFMFKIKESKEANTKRKILSLVTSIFYPLGLLAPVVLKAKRILKQNPFLMGFQRFQDRRGRPADSSL